MRTGKMTSESGSNGKSSNDSTPYSSLRRDASLIIPSMIPTQEVLRNLNYYRGNGMIQLNGDEDEEERNNDNKNHSNDSQDHVLSTHTDTPNSSTQSANTTLTPRRVSASESSVSYQFSSPQPSRPPRALRTYSRKRAITPPPPPPPVKLQSDGEDSDPIMDFDDSDEGEGGFGSGSSLTAHQHSLSKAQLANPPHSTHQPLVPPESPSRRFIIPPATQPVRGNSHRQSSTAALRARREKPAPESPSKRLRPLSEIPRPVVPKHIQLQQSPSKRSTSSNSSGSPRKQRTSKTNPPSGSASPSPSKTPSRAIGTTGFTPNMISHKALRPPAALGPQLLQIASEITNNCSEEDREQEEQDTLVRRRWKKNTEPVVADQDSLFLDDTGMALMTSDFFSEPQMGSPEIEPKPEPLSPTSSSILGKGSRKDVSESPFWVPNSPTISSSKTTGLVRVKKEESLTLALTVSKKELAEEPMMPQQSLQRREKQPIKEQPLPSEIPLPSLVLEYTPKLTPLDHIKWPPAKVGRFHILVLVIFINPEEQVVTKKGETVAKREINVCDQSATSFKLNLWGDCCKWADTQFKVGDAILITDVHTSEFRQKITGSTSNWSRVARLDGTLLAYYRGHEKVELYIKIFIEKRRCLALDLLDKDKGIARDPSLYLTHHMWTIPDEVPTNDDGAELHEIEPERDPRLQKPTNSHKEPGIMTLTSTATSMITRVSNAFSKGIGNNIPPSSSSSATSSELRMPTPTLLPNISGLSIRAGVVYKMLLAPSDVSQGWEIGVVMQNGRHLRIHCIENASSWINEATPGRVLIFYGRFKNEGSDIFYIEASARQPNLLRESSWGISRKNIKARKFPSIKSLRDHQFMGDAILDAYILAVSSPDFFFDDNDERAIFDFIQCYCTGCQTVAVSSPQNPSILFCRECHLDPKKRNQPLEWRYPAFELSLGDKPRMGANLTSETLQLRCQSEIGDQVFLSVPAREWMQDQEGFWESRKRWKRFVELMNRQGESVGDNDEGVSGPSDSIPQKVRVEVMVGVNMMTKALKVEYL